MGIKKFHKKQSFIKVLHFLEYGQYYMPCEYSQCIVHCSGWWITVTLNSSPQQDGRTVKVAMTCNQPRIQRLPPQRQQQQTADYVSLTQQDMWGIEA